MIAGRDVGRHDTTLCQPAFLFLSAPVRPKLRFSTHGRPAVPAATRCHAKVRVLAAVTDAA